MLETKIDELLSSFAYKFNLRRYAVSVDGDGAVVAAGEFVSPTATFGGVALTSASGADALLWKMNAQGTTMWAVRGGGGKYDQLFGVAAGIAGAVVATGGVCQITPARSSSTLETLVS